MSAWGEASVLRLHGTGAAGSDAIHTGCSVHTCAIWLLRMNPSPSRDVSTVLAGFLCLLHPSLFISVVW